MSKTISRVRWSLLAASAMAACTLSACAADGADDNDDQEEELQQTSSANTASAARQVVTYAERHRCDVGGNHIVMLDCPLSDLSTVLRYAKKKLHSKAYECGPDTRPGAGYICLDY